MLGRPTYKDTAVSSQEFRVQTLSMSGVGGGGRRWGQPGQSYLMLDGERDVCATHPCCNLVGVVGGLRQS